jgi:hypothetical protein
MRKLFIISFFLSFLFQFSCQENNTKQSDSNKKIEKVFNHFYGEKTGFLDSLINFAGLNPDTSYPFVCVILPVSYCEPCKVDVTHYLNDLFSKIQSLPKNNILIITEEMRKKEIPLYKKEDYPLNNWDSLHLVLSDKWGIRILKEFDMIGASMFVTNTDGKVIYKKQFKNTVEYFNDVDSVATLINSHK